MLAIYGIHRRAMHTGMQCDTSALSVPFYRIMTGLSWYTEKIGIYTYFLSRGLMFVVVFIKNKDT